MGVVLSPCTVVLVLYWFTNFIKYPRNITHHHSIELLSLEWGKYHIFMVCSNLLLLKTNFSHYLDTIMYLSFAKKSFISKWSNFQTFLGYWVSGGEIFNIICICNCIHFNFQKVVSWCSLCCYRYLLAW